MREWDRTTRRCGLDALPAGALARYAELHAVDDLESNVIACVETVSTPVKRRRLGPGRHPVRQQIVVTAAYLLWCTANGGAESVAAARLAEVAEVHEYRSSLIEDSGIEVTGFRLGGGERESWFLPLDLDEDGADFRHQLQRAIDAAKS